MTMQPTLKYFLGKNAKDCTHHYNIPNNGKKETRWLSGLSGSLYCWQREPTRTD